MPTNRLHMLGIQNCHGVPVSDAYDPAGDRIGIGGQRQCHPDAAQEHSHVGSMPVHTDEWSAPGNKGQAIRNSLMAADGKQPGHSLFVHYFCSANPINKHRDFNLATRTK